MEPLCIPIVFEPPAPLCWSTCGAVSRFLCPPGLWEATKKDKPAHQTLKATTTESKSNPKPKQFEEESFLLLKNAKTNDKSKKNTTKITTKRTAENVNEHTKQEEHSKFTATPQKAKTQRKPNGSQKAA